MMPAAVIAATETDPIARWSTAAMNQASRMLRMTGAPASAGKRSPSTCPSRSPRSPRRASRRPR